MKIEEICVVVLACILFFFKFFLTKKVVFSFTKKLRFLINSYPMPYVWLFSACMVSAYISGVLCTPFLILSWISYEYVKIKKQAGVEKTL